jgi:anaerobic magnesium-protoporphyrin IX monomethyl ester cyclase
MKVLFINPSLRPTAPHRYLPVGLGYVLTAVKLAGIPFELMDIDAADYSDRYVEDHFATHSYDVVCVGAIVTHYRWIKWLIRTIKQYQPHCKVVVGNSVGSSMPEILFNHAPADIVVLGEADFTTVELLEALRDGRPLGQIVEPLKPVAHKNGDKLPSTYVGTGIPGIIFRDDQGRLVNNGRRTATKLIDDLPYPDWDLFDVETYIERGRATAHETVHYYPREEAVVFPVNTARGCVFKCSFCHYVFWNDPYRHRSPQSVVGEISQLQQKYGANYIHFWDELSFHKVGPTEKFLDAFIAADLHVHWSAAVRTDLLGRPDVPLEERERVARKFEQAGCVVLGYSLESGSDEILEAMNKRVKSEYFGEQVRILRDAGIVSSTSLVFGYPQETKETIAQTMKMCEDLRVYPSAGFLLPFPATGMWAHAMDHGFVGDPDEFLTNMTERQDFFVNLTTMTDEEMKGEVTRGLAHLNEKFGGTLSKDKLIKTGGYSEHDKNQTKDVIRHRNTADTLNYATVAGAV